MPDDDHRRASRAGSPPAVPENRAALSLADLPRQVPATVIGVRPAGETPESRELALRLLEIGFMAGELVRVTAHGHPGREPLAVRVGGTTFALRRFEAEQVLVAVDATAVAGTNA